MLAARAFHFGAGVKTAPIAKGGWSSAQLPQPDPPEEDHYLTHHHAHKPIAVRRFRL